LPVVVSDAGGLPEVIVQGLTGLVVPKDNAQVAAEALLKLILSPDLRQQLGGAGRAHVLANYSWDASLKNMLAVYQGVIDQHKTKQAFSK
jgi:glycosyltransferase involved in cell wall biosynthesis